jgi:outer membrane protein assembly factor BamB
MDPYRRSIYTSSRRRRKAVARRRAVLAIGLVALAVLVVVASLLVWGDHSTSSSTSGQTTASSGSTSTGGSGTTSQTGSSSTSGSGQTSTTLPGVDMRVRAVASTSPGAFDIVTKLFRGTEQIPSFNREPPIVFGPGQDYTDLEGIITFRGNNYRDTASYGTAKVNSATLAVAWSVPTGSMLKTGGRSSWTGSGWTGQPLIVKWPEDLKQIMNLKAAKKADPDLVEVIYPCLDGNIYFLDLRDGTYTRPPIRSGGGPFKGTGSLYPNGTPILAVGHGDNAPDKEVVRARLYSLIDQSLLYTFGKKPDPNAYRKFHAYDSSALFDAETDTLIQPGENGILYTIKLNTHFDKEAGTLTVDPDPPVKVNYTSPLYKDVSPATTTARWWGMETSAVAWRNYLYVGENGGHLFCFDLNTMKLVWVQDTLDDTNASPVFEESPEDGTCYIYISTSLHITAPGTTDPRKGGIPIWKIDAATGEVVWQTDPYPCYTITDVSGGVQATPVLGRNDIADLVIFSIARTPNVNTGITVALDKKTGKEVWRTQFNHYAWSSPVAVYTPEGKSYLIQCDTAGNMFLLEGTTGKILDYINLGANIEASPAVFGNTIVVGTRGQKIFGVTLN